MTLELTQLERVTRELINHTSRTEIRRRNQLISEFQKLASPEVVLQLIMATKQEHSDGHGRS